MKNVAVIVGRFQTPDLTDGHNFLLEYALNNFEKVLVFVGVSPSNINDKNCLPYPVVRSMLNSFNNNLIINEIVDTPNDNVWSKLLDSYIYNITTKEDTITLLGSRDSFLNYYSGSYPTLHIESPIPHVSATELRSSVKINNTRDFREGLIFSQQSRFPIVYPTVDVGILKYNSPDNIQILLGRKPKETKYRLIGGFVDKADNSFEAAAWREAHEEVSNIQLHEVKYVSSRNIQDFRYRDTKDGVMTTLFVTFFLGGEPKPNDDIEEVKWFDFNNFDLSVLIEPHHILFNDIKKYLNEKKHNN